MMEKITITFEDNTTEQYPKGITLLEISKNKQKEFNNKIIIAKVNNKLFELVEKIEKSSHIEFFDITNSYGNKTYVRGLQFLLIKAFKDILGKDKEIKIEHSIDKGIYCETDEDLTEEIVNKIDNQMKGIVNKSVPFVKIAVNKRDMVEYYKENNQQDKIDSLKYTTNHLVTIYKLNDLYDYFYGVMPIDTSYLEQFELSYIEPGGIVLRYPTIYNFSEIKEYEHPKQLFEVFREYSKWGQIMNLSNVSDLNRIVSEGNANELIQIAETIQSKEIGSIADSIFSQKEKIKIVLIAGPSSSGKTTTAKKLSIHLKSKGLNLKNLSTDDYFVEREQTPKDSNGEFDYEAIDAIDIDLFNEHLTRLLNKEEVIIPSYNFITGEKNYIEENKMSLKENDILIIEGIHGLNEKLTEKIPREKKYKIYISPLTQLNIDNHNRIHTTDTRLLRRMIRDYKYRGYKPEDTIKAWKKVRKGEEIYIFPYQDEADIVLNSALIYEIGVLKSYVEPLLFSIDETKDEYIEARRLIYFLRNFLPISSEEIPKDSHLREFIGGSCFR